MDVTAARGAAAPQYQPPAPQSAQEAERGAVSPAPERPEQKTLAEMMKESREKIQARKEQLEKIPKNTRYGDAPMEAYARLGRARNKAQVTAAAGYARRQIAQLQSAKRTDSDNAQRIQAAINQLKKAVSRAGKKSRELDQERLAKARQKRLEREARKGEAARQRLALRQKQTARAIRESGYLREAEIDNRLQNQLAETRAELRAQALALSAAAAGSVDEAVREYSAQTAAAADPAAPAGGEISLEA